MNIYKKLSVIKTEIGAVVKSLKNNFANFSYTDLSNIFSKLNTILNKYDVLFNMSDFYLNQEKSEQTHKLIYSIKAVLINCDKPEETIEYAFDFPTDEEGKKMKLIQAIGSTMTYTSRYIYGFVFSLQFSDDADSESAKKDPAGKQLNSNDTQPSDTDDEIELKKLQNIH